MRIYLDHASSTPVDPRVLRRFVEIEQSHPANPGGPHTAGRRARAIVEEARAVAAAALGVESDQLVFTSGGTETNNAALAGLGPPDQPVLLAPVEHSSILRAAERRGAVWWDVDPLGRAILSIPDRPIGLVCLQHAQHEIGTRQPVLAARDLAASLGVPLHVDATSSLGRLDIADVVRAADSVALSTHKVGGLRGCTVAVVKEPGRLRPLVVGGAQERNLRAGTESPALVAATALTVQLAVEEQAARAAACCRARDTFERSLAVEAKRLGAEDALPNLAMMRLPVAEGRHLIPALDLEGIEASWGSACSSGAATPPPVLTAIGLDVEQARTCVRFSFSHHTSLEDVAQAAHLVDRVVRRLA
ncbi:MAG: aminotransferase class V-fold PLP-dependent enzyme [Planctomycetota bacterium]